MYVCLVPFSPTTAKLDLLQGYDDDSDEGSFADEEYGKKKPVKKKKAPKPKCASSAFSLILTPHPPLRSRLAHARTPAPHPPGARLGLRLGLRRAQEEEEAEKVENLYNYNLTA